MIHNMKSYIYDSKWDEVESIFESSYTDFQINTSYTIWNNLVSMVEGYNKYKEIEEQKEQQIQQQIELEREPLIKELKHSLESQFESFSESDIDFIFLNLRLSSISNNTIKSYHTSESSKEEINQFIEMIENDLKQDKKEKENQMIRENYCLKLKHMIETNFYFFSIWKVNFIIDSIKKDSNVSNEMLKDTTNTYSLFLICIVPYILQFEMQYGGYMVQLYNKNYLELTDPSIYQQNISLVEFNDTIREAIRETEKESISEQVSGTLSDTLSSQFIQELSSVEIKYINQHKNKTIDSENDQSIQENKQSIDEIVNQFKSESSYIHL